MLNKIEIEAMMKSLNVAPLKRYGQNFLIEERIANEMINYLLKHSKYDTILEIGPGLGALTTILTKKKIVIAIEIDRKYSQYLNDLNLPNLKVIQGNALKFPFKTSLSVISNMPYYISQDIVEMLVNHSSKVDVAVLTGQKEFVDKIFSKPGDEDYGPLPILVQRVGTPQKLFDISKTSFYPEPTVTSTAFSIHFKSGLNDQQTYQYFLFVKKLFNNRRKTILNNLTHITGDRLSAEAVLSKTDIPFQERPEQITPSQFDALFALCETYLGIKGIPSSKN